MLGRPANGVLIGGMFGDVIPVVGSTLFAEQLLKPLVAQHKHWIGIDHESCRFGGHTPLLQRFSAQQMQIVFFSISAKDLVLVTGQTSCLPFGRLLRRDFWVGC